MPSSQRRAVYAGSFDPLTNGHLWMVEQGLKLFDELTVAIGINPDKSYTFGLEERLDILGTSLPKSDQLSISHFENRYLVDYATEIGAGYILRGIRSAPDYEYERGMRHMNAALNDALTTVFLMPPREIAELSSSMVKGLVGPDGWEEHVEKLVPPAVLGALRQAH